LSWVGIKAARNVVEHQTRAREQHRVDRERHAAALEDARHGALIFVRTRLEEAIEWAEYPAERAFDAARDGVLGRAVCVQQLGRERRRQGQRVDRRDHRRDRDGHRELFVEGAGDAGQEGHRHEHRAQHQRDRHDWPGNLFHGLVRGFQRRAPFPDIALDVLDYDDRVVDD